MPQTHILFLVHGMGKPNDDTFNEWKNKLATLYGKYASADDRFDDLFKCVPINYDAKFEQIRGVWSGEINRLYGAMRDETAIPEELPARDDLSALTDDNFFTTHIMDVLMYRFIATIRQSIRDLVSGKIATEIRQGGNPPGSIYSIIGYSLGTAVIHDSINHMYHTTTDDHVSLKPTEFRFHAIAQLANVSRTLETTYDAYEPLIRPGINHSSGDRYAATRMLSASHVYDPLVSLRRFKPVGNWPDPETVAANRFALVEPDIIQQWNVHDLDHYLDDPYVHIPLLRMLRTRRFVSQAEESNAKDEFNRAHPLARFHRHRQELKKILPGESDFSWKRLLQVMMSFRDVLNSFADD